MFAKVHPAEDVKSGNTGSCHDLVRYLEKETGEGQRFFSHTEQDISPERVIMDIDGNKKALGANDAKFFMLSLNPSQSEQMHLIGRKVDDFKELTPQEKKEVFQKLEAFTRIILAVIVLFVVGFLTSAMSGEGSFLAFIVSLVAGAFASVVLRIVFINLSMQRKFGKFKRQVFVISNKDLLNSL